MSRLPTSRFPPPVLSQQSDTPAKSAPPYRASTSSPVLYDSDSYEEEGTFQLLPSPEHYMHGRAGHSPATASRKVSTSAQPVMYDEEDELVSPSSSYTSMSPSASLDHLPAPAAENERKSVTAVAGGGGGGRGEDNGKSRAVPVSRNNRVQHRSALRLDLMDGDDDGTNDEDEDEADTRQPVQRSASHAATTQLNGHSKQRPSTVSTTPILPAPASSTASSSCFSSVLPASSLSRTVEPRLMSSPSAPIPVRSSQLSHPKLSSSVSVSLPPASYDEYNDSMLAGHSLNDSPNERLDRLQRSSRDEDDEEDEGGFGLSADVIELEDEERDRESSGSARKGNQRGGGRALSATHAVAAPPPEHRSSLSPQLVPRLSPHPSPHHHLSSPSTISSLPTTTPVLITSSSVPVMSQSVSRPLRAVIPMTVRTSSVGALDDEGEDGDDEHDDQQNEERDDTSSAVISLSGGAHDKHDTLRTFSSTSPSPVRTLKSSYSMKAPSLSHHVSTSSVSSSASSSSSSSSFSQIVPVSEQPISPPMSGNDDGEGDEYNDDNDDNVTVVTSPHHSHSPSRAHQQQPGQATDEEEESEPAFLREQEEEEDTEPLPKPKTPLLSPVVTPSASATPSRRPSGVSSLADDEFAEAKLRREKLIAGKAARLAKKNKHERWDTEKTASRNDIRRSAARKVSKRSNERNRESDGSSQSTDSDSDSSSSSTEHSGEERRDAEDNTERARDTGSASSNRRSPVPRMSSVSPPSPLRPPMSQQPSSRSSPIKATHRLQHDDLHHHTTHQFPHHPLEQHDEITATTRRRTSTKQRDTERRPSANSRDRSPLPPAHPPTLSRTNSGNSRSQKKKKRSGGEDEIRVADLEFKEKIGEGAYGDVYRGYLWGQEVAIKQIRLEGGKEEAEEETIREFRREMKIMKHLRHPNVVEFLGSCMSEQSLCLLTEYLPNGSLEDHLARLRREGKVMRESRVVSLSFDVAKGLNWLHHKGIIHRDLKPANILLDSAGKPRLIDFGLSHVRRRRDESMSGFHGVAGTPSYIAPEVLMGREYGVKADVYSLGVLINEMLTTVAPYDDTPLTQLDLPAFEAAVIAGGRPKLAESRNPVLSQLVVDCWQADADSRPTVESIMKTLERIDKDIQAQQQQQLTAPTAESASTSLDDLPTPLRSLLANDYARLYQLQAALAEQERQLQARSAAMATAQAAREEEQKQWEEKRDKHKREEGDENSSAQK